MDELKQEVVDLFEIPDALAQELSELLTKQMIRERILIQVVGDNDKFAEIEKSLIPITSRIEFIKNKITTEYVPEKYSSNKYMWNYESYEIAKNQVQIIRVS